MEFNRNNEPFIRLPSPHSNLKLTPPRHSDGEAASNILNDPKVYMNLTGPPFPYIQKDWDCRFSIVSKLSKDALAEWKEVEERRRAAKETGVSGRGRVVEEGRREWIGVGAPVMSIREVDQETLEERYLGEIMIRRCEFLMVADKEERRRIKEENDALRDGDPEIAWEFGYYLAPSHHGRGIMPVAVRTLLDKILVPYMNVHHITGSFLEHNIASRRVFEKNGFIFDGIVPDLVELLENKTGVKGKKVGLGVLRWDRE